MTKSITVTSAIRKYGDRFVVSYRGHPTEVEGDGIGLVVYEKNGSKAAIHTTFDFEIDAKITTSQFCSMIDKVKDGSYVVLGLKGDGIRGLTTKAKKKIMELGSKEIEWVKENESWAMMVKKGERDTIHEFRYPDLITFNQTF